MTILFMKERSKLKNKEVMMKVVGQNGVQADIFSNESNPKSISIQNIHTREI